MEKHTTTKKTGVRRAVSPLRLNSQERLALEFLVQELGLSQAAASRLSIVQLAKHLQRPGYYLL